MAKIFLETLEQTIVVVSNIWNIRLQDNITLKFWETTALRSRQPIREGTINCNTFWLCKNTRLVTTNTHKTFNCECMVYHASGWWRNYFEFSIGKDSNKIRKKVMEFSILHADPSLSPFLLWKANFFSDSMYVLKCMLTY